MNATSLFPSAMDLVLAVPRLAQRAGTFAFSYVPEQLEELVGRVRDGGSVIAEPTVANTTRNATTVFEQGTTAPTASETIMARAAPEASGGLLQNLKSLGGIFTYLTSRWGVTTLVLAILLNRTHFYASPRIPVRVRWPVRLALHLVPIVMLVHQVQIFLQAIRCQTSPHWPQLRYGDEDTRLSIDFAGEGGILYRFTSALLFWQGEAASCLAVNLIPAQAGSKDFSGTYSLLWPAFVTFCFSQFVEILSGALQRQQPKCEAITVFEHSLAYAEAESIIIKPLNLGLNRAANLAAEKGESFSLTPSMIHHKLNASPEVLLISLISILTHLSGNVLAVFGLRTRFRLVNTTIWGLAYMGALVWKYYFLVQSGNASSVFVRIPTVFLVGFLPHLTILIGLCGCAAIYGLALLLTALSLPQDNQPPRTMRERLSMAFDNLQAKIHMSVAAPFSLDWTDDFYTVLLKAGFSILTAASEAVYLNEGTNIRVSQLTWLEEKRIDELAKQKGLLFKRTLESIPQDLHGSMIAEGVTSVDESGGLANSSAGLVLRSGYARERKAKRKGPTSGLPAAAETDDGVGTVQRRSRWIGAFMFMKGVFWLMAGFEAKAMALILQKLGITYRPQWLSRLIGEPHSPKDNAHQHGDVPVEGLQFWRLSEDGSLRLPQDTNVDVEAETRRRLDHAGQLGIAAGEAEEKIGESLYTWWKFGGWWGEVDSSGDYQAQEQEDDTTSVISTSTALSDSEAWSDTDDDGRRTPTQNDPYPGPRGSTLEADDMLNPSHLASLLDPSTPEAQEEAKMFARHLRSEGVLTRSQYRKNLERENTRLLFSSRLQSNEFRSSANSTLSPAEEERALEQFILNRRVGNSGHSASTGGGTWDTGAEGMGSGGPQCVVCQLSPRTILVWPCGCLSLCDDCRVGLATRNFSACVCCRTDVVAYSRLYVP